MKNILLSAIITLLALPSVAQQIMIDLKNSDQDYQIATLNELQNITFNGSTVNIARTNGSTYSETMGNINRIYFSDEAVAIPGDVTNDGSVNVADVTFVVSAILAGNNSNIADINKDGSVNVADVTRVVSIILNSGTPSYTPALSSATASYTLYVNNSNATYQAIDASEIEQITFNETQQLITFELYDEINSTFATTQISDIAYYSNNGTALTYDTNKNISFNAGDESSYNEIVETIVTDETVDESGDFVENFSTSKIIAVTFSETGVTCEPAVTGITITNNGNHVVINSTVGKIGYIVRGNCSNGSLKIYSTKKFKMQLAGLTLTNPTGPAINIQSGKTVYMVLSAINSLCDGAVYSTAATTADGTLEDQKGTLFSEGQLIFSGGGTLNVTSHGGHAICSDDYIRVRNCKINILSAAKDGFHTNDLFRVGRTESASPTITINAQSDGIDCGKGEVLIEAGKITMNTGGEGINASNSDIAFSPSITIKGGYIKATTTGEKSAVIKTSGNFNQAGGIIQGEVKGNGSKIVNCDGNITFTEGKITGFSYGTLSSDSTTAGGFKCEGDIIINGGTIALDNRGQGSKGFNCNGNIIINGGNTTLLATGENFIDDNYDKYTRAITAYNITVNGGNLYTRAYDHAINATNISFTAGTIQAYSENALAVSGNATQSGGWLLTQYYE